MKKSEMKEYIKKQECVSIPALQAQFSLRYSSLRKLFRELERADEIRLDDDGLNYRVLGHEAKIKIDALPPRLAEIAEDLEIFPLTYRRAVCLTAKAGRAEEETLRRELDITPAIALNVMSWMEDIGVTKKGKFSLSQEEWRLLATALRVEFHAPKTDTAVDPDYFQTDIDFFLQDAEKSDKKTEDQSAPEEEERTIEWWEKHFHEEMQKRHGDAPNVRKFGDASADEEPPADPSEEPDAGEGVADTVPDPDADHPEA